MPRINRNDVVFEVNDREWLARFTHTHNESGFLHHIGDGKLVPVKHLTLCKLSYRNESGVFLQGQAPCGMKDKYDWQRGIKLSLLRALEKGGFCKLHKHVCSTCFMKLASHTNGMEMGARTKHPYREAEIVAEPLKPEYGKIVAAFYRELPIRDYWPHRPEDKPKPVVSEIPKDALPPVITGYSAAPEGATHGNYIGPTHGIGWSGAD